MPHRSRVFKTRVLCKKKNFTYSGVFKPYSDILKLYSGIFLPKKICKYQVWEPYSGVFKPYSDVLKPYSGVFLPKKKKKKIKYQVQEPYSGVFKPYSDVLKPCSGVFLQFIEIEFLKLDFHVDFFPHHIHPLTNRDLQT